MAHFLATIQFEMPEEFMEYVPPHRTYINFLINKGTIEHYAVSMETRKVWITMVADSKQEVEDILSKSPLHKFWLSIEVDELFVLDGQHYRLPALQMN